MAAELTVHRGGEPPESPEALAWDGEFELWLAGAMIGRLKNEPPPAGSAVASDARAYAGDLASSGRARLAAAGVRAGRPAPQPSDEEEK